jgi:hypothetical protein
MKEETLTHAAGCHNQAPPDSGAGGLNSHVLTEADVQRIAEAVCKILQPPASSDTRYWSVERAAHECGEVSKRTFAQWMADGKIRIRPIGGRVLIDPKMLEEDLAKYQVRRISKRRKHQPQKQTPALAQAPLSGQMR